MEAGLDPTTDEFKSGLRMDKNPEQKELRKYLKRLIHDVKISVVLSGPDEMDFKKSTSNAIVQLIENNKQDLIFPMKVYIETRMT